MLQLTTLTRALKATGDQTAEVTNAIALNQALVDSIEGGKVAETIGRAPRPLTAILFSPSLERRSFKVRGTATDPTMGILDQDEKGGTAGVLLAAEAPLSYLKIPEHKKVGGQYLPIGAWFGVQLADSSGDVVSTVEFAAGVSFMFISKNRLAEIVSSTSDDLGANPARLLLGVVYGTETELASGYEVGDSFPLAQEPPTREHRTFALTVGLGFRF